MRVPDARSPQAQRFVAAGGVVVAVALALLVFGRPGDDEPTVAVVAAAEPWAAGRTPGDYVTVQVPASSAALFVTPSELEGRVPATAVPAGVVLSAALLVDQDDGLSAADPTAALLAVRVDSSLWPDPGPAAGDTAVLAAAPGGCATAVLALAGVGDSTVVVEAGPATARVLAPSTWWVWKSPSVGWPSCPAGPGGPGGPGGGW